MLLIYEISSSDNSEPKRIQVNEPLIIDLDAPVAHVQNYECLKQTVIKIDIVLNLINEQVEELHTIINELKAKSKDATTFEDMLNCFINDKKEFIVEKENLVSNLLEYDNAVGGVDEVSENLENANAVGGVDEVSENLGCIIPEKDAITFSLDNATKNLAESDASSSASVATTSDKSVALDEVVSLLHEGNGDPDNILKLLKG